VELRPLQLFAHKVRTVFILKYCLIFFLVLTFNLPVLQLHHQLQLAAHSGTSASPPPNCRPSSCRSQSLASSYAPVPV
jgi:hypothetical protein